VGVDPAALAHVFLVGRQCDGGEDRHDDDRDHQLDQRETAGVAWR
jgi:hypothetical protein